MSCEVSVLTWFLATTFFCLVIVFSVGYRQTQCAALQRLRDQIAADLHDDIGANLSQLALLSEVLRHQTGAADPQLAHSLKALSDISRATMNALGDIVWATNPHQDGFSNLLRRMRHFASEILPAAGVEFSFHAPKFKSELRLDTELRRQVFLIFKESINNLVRHSGCSCAVIEVQLEGGYLTLRISDNGSGFASAQPAEGNGLRSMSRRANTLGADFSIISSAAGTTILLCARQRQSAGQWAQQWLTVVRQQSQFRLRSVGVALHTYLNRGVTALTQPPTLPLQPITAAAKNEKSPSRH